MTAFLSNDERLMTSVKSGRETHQNALERRRRWCRLRWGTIWVVWETRFRRFDQGDLYSRNLDSTIQISLVSTFIVRREIAYVQASHSTYRRDLLWPRSTSHQVSTTQWCCCSGARQR